MPDLHINPNAGSFGLVSDREITTDTSRALERQSLVRGGNIPEDRFVYKSYSGVDIVATLVANPGNPPVTIGELETISYSIHRQNNPVRTLGNTNPRGFVKGPRTIGGSLIFTQFDKYFFYRVHENWLGVEQGFFPLADMMPPFDVVLSFSNESGNFSKMSILGITIVDEGGVMSIDDIKTEQTYTFMARGIRPLTPFIPDGHADPSVGERLHKEVGVVAPRNTIGFR